MRRKGPGWGSALLALLAAILPLTLGTAFPTPHITLDDSIPADDATVAGEVMQVRLFFSGAPLLRGASVRIVTSSRSLIRSSPPAVDPEDPTQLFVNLDTPLPLGAYLVQWRCVADDGHVMRGDFRFEVAAGAAE